MTCQAACCKSQETYCTRNGKNVQWLVDFFDRFASSNLYRDCMEERGCPSKPTETLADARRKSGVNSTVSPWESCKTDSECSGMSDCEYGLSRICLRSSSCIASWRERCLGHLDNEGKWVMPAKKAG